MAESASDPNVEDVLSSVRRLVSQELPKRTAEKPVSDPGALVLTSKDRIEAEHSKRVAAKSLEQRIAELEKAVDETATEFEPDGSEDQAQHRPDRIVYTRPRPSEAEAKGRPSTLRLSEIALIDTGEPQEADTTSEPAVAFRHGGARPADAAPKSDEAPMAEDVPTLPSPKADVQAFSDPDDVVARIEARIEQGGVAPEPPAEAPKTNAEAAPKDADDFDAELTAAVRASIALDPVQDESDAVTGDTLSPEEVKAPDPATPEPKSADAAPSKPSPETDSKPPVLDVAQAAILTARAKSLKDSAPVKKTDTTAVKKAEAALGSLADEDAMRLLVGRLIREELQGELGERLTQNVRKLVRSEIKRVLESRTLD
ncbi:MAG: hypothetical protein AAGK71_15295 [Pseudomonadota bacterium]